MDTTQQWNREKQSILQSIDSMNIPSEGLTIITSFTDKTPLNGWTLPDAIRELWQNFRDGIDAPIKFEMTPPDASNAIQFKKLKVFDKKNSEIGSVDASKDGVLQIIQKNISLLPKHLQLASFKNTNCAGGHGEGFKLAICYLLTKGYDVEYTMVGQRWTFEFKSIYDKQFSNMIVRVKREKGFDYLNAMTITIKSEDAHNLFDPNVDWNLAIILNNSLAKRFSSTCSSYRDNGYNSIVIPDVKPNTAVIDNGFWVYSRNIFVSNDSNVIKALRIAVNLSEQQTRDRHVLPPNMIQQLAKIFEEILRSEGHEILFEHVVNRMKIETEEIIFMKEAAVGLREVFRKYYGKKLKVSDYKRIKFCNLMKPQQKKILESIGYRIVDDVGVLEDSINIDRESFHFACSLPDVTNKYTNNAIFKNITKFIIAVKPDLKIMIIKTESQLTEWCGCGVDIIMITDDMMNMEINVVMSLIYSEIRRWSADDTLMKQIYLEFIKNPDNYTHNVNREEDDRQNPTRKRHRNENKIKIDNNNLEDLFKCDSTKSLKDEPIVMHKDDPIDETECDGHSFTPNYDHPRLHPDIDIIVDKNCQSISSKRDVILNKIDLLRDVVYDVIGQISTRMPRFYLQIPIIYIYTDSNLYGFTKSPDNIIYLNIKPLIDVSAEELKYSIFSTILHELCHRKHLEHNSEFSDLLVSLSYQCGLCKECIQTSSNDEIHSSNKFGNTFPASRVELTSMMTKLQDFNLKYSRFYFPLSLFNRSVSASDIDILKHFMIDEIMTDQQFEIIMKMIKGWHVDDISPALDFLRAASNRFPPCARLLDPVLLTTLLTHCSNPKNTLCVLRLIANLYITAPNVMLTQQVGDIVINSILKGSNSCHDSKHIHFSIIYNFVWKSSISVSKEVTAYFKLKSEQLLFYTCAHIEAIRGTPDKTNSTTLIRIVNSIIATFPHLLSQKVSETVFELQTDDVVVLN